MPLADTPMGQDQGILASTDIVAIEQAAYDLINKAAPLPNPWRRTRGCVRVTGFRLRLGADGQEHLDVAAELDLGTKECELVKVEEKSD